MRYVLAGLFNTAVSFGGYSLLLMLGLSVPSASLGGLLGGLAVGFLTQGKLVFGNAGAASFVRFLVAWAAMYLLHVGIVTGLMQVGVNPFAGGVVAMGVIVALSYFVLRDLVFRAGRTDRLRT